MVCLCIGRGVHGSSEETFVTRTDSSLHRTPTFAGFAPSTLAPAPRQLEQASSSKLQAQHSRCCRYSCCPADATTHSVLFGLTHFAPLAMSCSLAGAIFGRLNSF